jgi:transposase-like protein
MAKASISALLCTVCPHVERAVIENTLANGASQSATAKRFGVSKSALNRHWLNHVSPEWKSAAKMGPYGSREELEKLCLNKDISVVANLQALYASCHAFLIANREAGATVQFLAVVARMQSLQRDIAKITGEILPHVTTNVTNNLTVNNLAFLTSFGDDLAAALADMPDALDRIHGVLSRRMTPALPAPQTIEGLSHAA